MDLTTLMTDHEAARQAERRGRHDKAVTASAVNPLCRRQLALKRAATTDPTPEVGPATVGTLIHAGIAEVWRTADPHAQVEVPVAHGTADVIRPRQQEVRDLKTLSRFGYDRWLDADGPDPHTWGQLSIYAHDVGADDGWTLVIDAMCRETGRTRSYQKPYTIADGDHWLKALDAVDVETDPTDPWGAAPDGWGKAEWVCQNCPFAVECLDSHPTDTLDVDEVAEAAADYRRAQAAERVAKDAKRAAGKRLQQVADGTYGDYTVRWVTVDQPERTLRANQYAYVKVGRS